MPIKFVDCYNVEIKHKAYQKPDPNSTQGIQQNRVKITTVRDCKRINIENEEIDRISVDNELEDELPEADEQQEEAKEEAEPTLSVLMENFRRYIKNTDPD